MYYILYIIYYILYMIYYVLYYIILYFYIIQCIFYIIYYILYMIYYVLYIIYYIIYIIYYVLYYIVLYPIFGRMRLPQVTIFLFQCSWYAHPNQADPAGHGPSFHQVDFNCRCLACWIFSNIYIIFDDLMFIYI